jgi:hypothetical protein
VLLVGGSLQGYYLAPPRYLVDNAQRLRGGLFVGLTVSCSKATYGLRRRRERCFNGLQQCGQLALCLYLDVFYVESA